MTATAERNDRAASSADIYWDVRGRLITASFEAGQKLKPDELRLHYGCAASTIREVLFRLSCDQLVEFQDQRGFRVPQASRLRLKELTQLRTIIEQECVRLSIANGGLEWEANLTAAHHKLAHVEDKMHAADDQSAFKNVWCAGEWEFHNTLISACGSATLIAAYRDIYDRQRQQLVMAVENSGSREGNIAEHRGVLDAALARDAELCTARIETHLKTGLKALKDGVR